MCLVMSAIERTVSHPQCLDLRPPFEVQGPGLQMCSKYNSFSCCDQSADAELLKEFTALASLLDVRESGQCLDYLQELMCLRCSPYAAHVFDSEMREERTFPGLCAPYCHQLFDTCRDVIPMISNVTTLVTTLSQNADVFCALVAIPDLEYCFPDLETNDILNREIDRTVVSTDGCLCVEPFADGLSNPLMFAAFPDGSGRIMVGEQLGIAHVFYRNKTKVVEPFLDIRRVILTSNSPADERGFLGFAFHPNFVENRKFYIYYSTLINMTHHSRISEFRADPDNPNKAESGSERVILEVEQPKLIHNGGQLLFGVDGYLYIFLGDGGVMGDHKGVAQNRTQLLGKVLRLDIDSTSDGKAYGIPPTNPYACPDQHESCRTPWRQEIYAYGIRNIWRCGMDRGHPETGYGRGRIFCGDVGQASWEEIDEIQAGGNYGWSKRQGNACYRRRDCDVMLENEVRPLYVYNHTVGKSVTGGHFYRGCMNPNMMGWYIFADYYYGKLFKLEEDEETGEWKDNELFMCETDVCFNGLDSSYPRYIMSLGEDAEGEIYILTTRSPRPSENVGNVYKLVDPRRRGDPATCRTNKPPEQNETKEEDKPENSREEGDKKNCTETRIKESCSVKTETVIRPSFLSCEELYPWLHIQPGQAYNHLGCVSSHFYENLYQHHLQQSDTPPGGCSEGCAPPGDCSEGCLDYDKANEWPYKR